MANTLADFVANLTPDLEKKRILESITDTRTEISEITLPTYEKMLAFKKDVPFKSSIFNEFNSVGDRLIQNARKVDIVHHTHFALKNHLDNLDKLYGIVDRYKASTVTVESITYQRANVMQLIEGINGFVRYATRMAGLLYLSELGHIEAHSIQDIRLPEYTWLAKNRTSFFSVMDVGLRDPKKLAATIDKLPDLIVNEDNVETVEESTKAKPIVSNLVAGFSPILSIRRLIEDFRDWRQRRLETEREWLESCYAQARYEKEMGGENAAITKRIEYYSGQLEKIDKKLRDIEASPE